MKIFSFTLGLILTSGIVFSQSEVDQKPTKHQQNQSLMSHSSADSDTIFTPTDLKFLKYSLDLAEEALEAGDQPFGSILVNAENDIIAEARNRINEKNVLAHPEIELAEWAIENLSLEERQQTKMYTTGEHCPMCAGAHAWAQIGGLYYLSSAKQLGKWLNEFGVDSAPIEFIPAEEIVKNAIIKGPTKGEMLMEIKQMHKSYYQD
ncbi:tRNA(Arg) A34 adenosine deaminase TadA [Salegentibacter holothuriorum]|uniref:tRNA(Arg) A34 adenosine deaminase TadA n=1 Tax=Salegentibacter holothuriorum TaxID=241145 RepID=A0A1T5AK56_9FLAO|nr:nucleoside deaminase [Salegentibacter holothuriorum]SKB35402.1 tRNA(Arg) A34 adenosine deaminase TadA [Salegentibacter holothuriorum]